MDDTVFKCPVCGGDVRARLELFEVRGEVRDAELVFRCASCLRWTAEDITDLVCDAREFFDDLVERIEGAV